MALFKHTYSGLITGGLGLPACCGLITLGFGVFKCIIEVYEGAAGGGGGWSPNGGFYVPMSKPITSTTKMVLVTVRIKDKTWRRSYVVDRYKASIVVRAVSIINALKDRLTVGADSFRKVKQRVTAVFKRSE